MSTTVGSYLLDSTPDRPGWRGRGLDQRLDRPVEVAFLGTLDAQTLSWLLAMAPAASNPRPEVATLTDLVFAGGGWYAIAQPAGSDQNLGNLSGGSGLALLTAVASTTARLHAEGIWHGAMGRWWRLLPGRAALAGLGYAWVLEPQRLLSWEQGFQADLRFLQGQLEGLATDGTIDRRVPAQVAALAMRGGDGPALRTMAREIAATLQTLSAGASGTPVAATPAATPASSGPIRRTVQLSAAELAALGAAGQAGSAEPAAPTTDFAPQPLEPPGPRPPTAYLPSGVGASGPDAPPLARTVVMPEGEMPRMPLAPGRAPAPAPPPPGAAGGWSPAGAPPAAAPAAAAVPAGATVMMEDAPGIARAAGALPARAAPAGGLSMGAAGRLVPSNETMIEERLVQRAPAAAPAPVTRPAGGGHRVVLLLVALGLLGLVAVAALAGLWWYRRSAVPPAPPPVATAEPPPVAPPGTFRVAAVPWAFAEIVPAAGQSLPPELQGRRPTPLTGELPAGSWQVRLTHPAMAEARTCTLEVAGGRVADCREVMQQWTVDDYFATVGWR